MISLLHIYICTPKTTFMFLYDSNLCTTTYRIDRNIQLHLTFYCKSSHNRNPLPFLHQLEKKISSSTTHVQIWIEVAGNRLNALVVFGRQHEQPIFHHFRRHRDAAINERGQLGRISLGYGIGTHPSGMAMKLLAVVIIRLSYCCYLYNLKTN